MSISSSIRKCDAIKVILWAFIAFLYLLNLSKPHLIDVLIHDSFIGNLLKQVYASCHESDWAKIILSFSFIFLLFFLFLKYKDTSFGKKTLSIALLSVSIWILIDDYWEYPTLFGFSFRWIFGIGLALTAAALIFAKGKKPTGNNGSVPNSSLESFSHDTVNGIADQELRNFTVSLINRLRNTDTTSTSFAAGIIGAWGTGKTVFLGAFRNELDRANELSIDFNPWMSMTDRSLVKSFFNLLSDKVSTKIDPRLRSPLAEYADALVLMEGNDSVISKIISLLGVGHGQSASSLKKEISDILKENSRKVYVFIDDLDRLTADEIFEVLRLIRNSADFSNIVYIAAYDRDYVEDILHKSGIDRAAQYLEKIFNVEIDIPKTTSPQLKNMFKEEVSDMGLTVDDATLDRWSGKVMHYLSSYREVKRFSRHLALILSYMRQNIGSDEFLEDEVLWLELIRYIDPKLYNSLRNETVDTLKYELNNDGVYCFVSPINESDKVFTFRDSKRLLKKLFGNENPDRRSLKYLNNFQRYFTYRLEPNVITKAELNDWLTDTEEARANDRFQQMVEKADDGHSLLYHLAKADAGMFSTSHLKTAAGYLNDIYFKDPARSKCARKILINLIDYCRNFHDRIDVSAFFQWMGQYFVDKGTSHSAISQLLKSIRAYVPEVNTHVSSLEVENFKRFLSETRPSPMDMGNIKSPLRVIYSNSIIWSSVEYWDPSDGDRIEAKQGETALFDPMMEYFRQHPGENRSKFHEQNFCYETIDEHGVTYIEDIPEDMAEEEAIKIFGSSQNYETFYKEAFNS